MTRDLMAYIATLEAENAILRDMLTPKPRQRPTRSLAAIMTEACAAAGLSRYEMISKSRDRRISWPRQDAMRMALDAGHTSTDVARFLRMDHSTVLYGAAQSRKRQAPPD
jgi:chromosomal replication initiation ATPase DnaA